MKYVIVVYRPDNGGYLVQLTPMTFPSVPVKQEYSKDVNAMLAIVERFSESMSGVTGCDHS